MANKLILPDKPSSSWKFLKCCGSLCTRHWCDQLTSCRTRACTFVSGKEVARINSTRTTPGCSLPSHVTLPLLIIENVTQLRCVTVYLSQFDNCIHSTLAKVSAYLSTHRHLCRQQPKTWRTFCPTIPHSRRKRLSTNNSMNWRLSVMTTTKLSTLRDNRVVISLQEPKQAV